MNKILILLMLGFLSCQSDKKPEYKVIRVSKTKVTLKDSINYDKSRTDTVSFNWYTITKCIIKKWEGYNDNSYYCSANVKTVAWGITRPEIEEINKIYKTDYKFEDFIGTKPMGISNDFLILCIDYRTSLFRGLYPQLPANEIGCVVSLSFNVGDNAVLNSSISKTLNIKNDKIRHKKLIKSILSFNKVKGKPNKGLTNRRLCEVKLIRKDFSQYELNQLFNEIKNLNKK